MRMPSRAAVIEFAGIVLFCGVLFGGGVIFGRWSKPTPSQTVSVVKETRDIDAKTSEVLKEWDKKARFASFARTILSRSHEYHSEPGKELVQGELSTCTLTGHYESRLQPDADDGIIWTGEVSSVVNVDETTFIVLSVAREDHYCFGVNQVLKDRIKEVVFVHRDTVGGLGNIESKEHVVELSLGRDGNYFCQMPEGAETGYFVARM